MRSESAQAGRHVGAAALPFVLACALSLAFAAACDETNGMAAPPPPPVAVPDTPPTLDVEVGGGLTRFEALADGGSVALVFGPQGGYHIWTAVRVRDVDFGAASVNLSVRHEDGSAAGTPASAAANFVKTDEGVGEAAGLRAYVERDEPAGTPLILRAEVVSPGQRHGTSERRVVVTR